jgi:NAD(P)-dependent dehydrogenase (short-subunit alcohol dehydrogenase family)
MDLGIRGKRAIVTGASKGIGLVNDAGGARPGTFSALTDEDWQADIMVKLFSMIRFSREAIHHMPSSCARAGSW